MNKRSTCARGCSLPRLFHRLLCTGLLLLWGAASAPAAITVINYYQLGEDDPGSAAGNVADATTVDIAGGNSLTSVNGPAYACDVSPAAATATGSRLDMTFNGANQCLTGSLLTNVTDNFCLEAWVKPASSGSGMIAYNGNSSQNGWGLCQSGTSFLGLYGWIGYIGPGTATVGVWTHLALVRNAGVTTLYVNGVAAGPSSTSAPVTPAGGFAIGAAPEAPASGNYAGEIDQVRLFTFAAGQFDPSQLLVNAGPVVQSPTLVSSQFVPAQLAQGIPELALSVNPNNADTTVYCVYGLTTNYGSSLPSVDIGGGTCVEPATFTFPDLVAGTVYHCQVYLESASGTTNCPDQTFSLSFQVLDYYPLGENDYTYAGDYATEYTADIVGSHALSCWNAPLYSCDVSEAAALTTGSDLSLSFDGANQYASLPGTVLSTATTGICLEGWAEPGLTNGPDVPVMFNGDPGYNGLGVVLRGGQWQGLLGGIAYFGGAPATPGVWDHLAVVTDQGVSTLYVNGISAGTYGSAPAAPTSGFYLAGYPADSAEYFSHFNGLLDQVRFSTFLPGQFRAGSLLLNAPTAATLPAPLVFFEEAVNPTFTTIQLTASVNPNRAGTQVYFQYGLTADYGSCSTTNLLQGGCEETTTILVSGLAGGATYHFQAIAVSAFGTNASGDATFTLEPSVPAATTLGATAITTNAATLNALVYPNGAPTTVWFEYGLTTSLGSYSAATVLTGSLGATQSVALTLSGLTSQQEYFCKVIVSNLDGVVVGDITNFAIPAIKVLDYYPLGEADPGAVAGGPANPFTVDIAGANNLASSNAPVYSCDVDQAAALTTESELSLDFNGIDQFLSGPALSPAVSEFCLEAWVKADATNGALSVVCYNGNSALNGWGIILANGQWLGLLGYVTFFGGVPATPGLWTHLAVVNDQGSTTLYVNGTNGGGTTATPNAPAGSFTVAALSAGASCFNGLVDQVRLSSILPGHFNTNELLLNAPATPLPAPQVVAQSVTGLGFTTATLSATVNPNRAVTQVWFCYGLTSAYGSCTPTNVCSGSCLQSLGAALTGLTGDATYHYQIVAASAFGTNVTPDATFTLTGGLPAVTTLAASAIGATNATLNAAVYPDGAPTSLWFQYGQTTNFGSLSATTVLTAGLDSTQNIALTVSALTSGRQYFCQVIASNSAGVVYGSLTNFTETGINVLDYYPLGEADAGAVAGGLADASTVDIVGTHNLQSAGGPAYSCDVAQAAALTTDSELSLDFNGSNQYLSGPVLTTTTNGVCLEAWVKPRALTSSISPVAYNGDPAGNGLGLVLNGGQWQGLLGGIAYFGGAPATAGVWTHLAVVSIQGTNTLYVNGTNAGSFTAIPTVPASAFMIAGFPSDAAAFFTCFNGWVDQVRLSTFQPGQFNTNDLLLNGAPVTNLPAPQVLAQSVSGVSFTAATLNATVNPNRTTTQVYFSYGLTTSYGSCTGTNVASGGCVQSLSASLTGLTGGATYHYQTVAASAFGTNVSPDATFTLTAGLPAAATLGVSAIGTTTATVNAAVYPDGTPSAVWVQYGSTTNFGLCTTPTVLSAGLDSTQNLALPLVGLAGNSRYYCQVIASNILGVTLGGLINFGTAGVTALHYYPMGEADAGAVAGALANAVTVDTTGANNLACSNAPVYSCDVAQTAALTTDSELSLGFNGTNQWLSGPVLCTATSQFCLEAWVKAGAANGAISVAAYNGDPAHNGWGIVLNNGAWQGLLGGVAYFGGAPATPGVWTHVALVNDQGTNTLYVNGHSAGTLASVPLVPASSFTIAGFPADAAAFFVYFGGWVDQVRLCAFQPGEFTTNDLLLNGTPVTTLPAPQVLAQSVTDITITTALLNATVNPNRADTRVWFCYGLTSAYGSCTATNVLGGGCDQTAAAALTGLAVGSTYHYQTVAVSAFGTNASPDATFTLVAGEPNAATLSASAIGTTTATFNAVVYPNGLPTTVWFQYGLSTNFGGLSASVVLTSGLAATQNVALTVGGLTAKGQYYFQVVASNSLGVVFGATDLFYELEALDYYPLGEADPAAVAGWPIETLTLDIAGTNHLSGSNAPLYSCDVAPSAALTTGSDLALYFNGINQFLSGPVQAGAASQFCLEAWARAASNNGPSSVVAFNGDPAHNGAGLVLEDGKWQGLLGGVTYFGGAPATPGSWTHLAVVNDQGVTTLYVNGVAAGASTLAPVAPTGTFMIAGFPADAAAYFTCFAGGVDQVRLTTFLPGGFSTNALLLNGAVTPLPAPQVLTQSATNLSFTTATLSAAVNPNRADTQVYFRFGLTSEYGGVSATNVISGGCVQTVAIPVGDLTGGATYHYQAVAVSAYGSNASPDSTFALVTGLPAAVTLGATNIGTNSATLNAAVYPNGLPTAVWFQYGPTTNLGGLSASTVLNAGLAATQNVAVNLSGLTAGQAYFCQVIASNSAGLGVGGLTNFGAGGILVLDYYPLGEADAGAVAGMPADAFTTDTVGTNNLGRLGLPVYSCDVAQSAALTTGSGLSMDFGGAGQALSGPLLTATATQYCLEVWVRATVTNGPLSGVLYNGNPALNGWGVVLYNGQWQGLLGNVAFFGGAPATPGVWTHLAVVNDQGATTLYVNGASAGATAAAPNVPTGSFSVAALSAGGGYFNGLADQVRLTAFFPGQFSTNDLLLNAPATPLPSPTITAAVADLTPVAATLDATVSPNGANVQFWFRYGLTTGYGAGTATNTLDGSCLSSPVFPIGGLTPATTYHYQAVLVSSAGTITTPDGSFTTPGLIPIVTPQPASGANASSATLNALVCPDGASASVWFQYGLNTNYGSFSATNVLSSSLSSTQAVAILLSGLPVGTVFHYQAMAGNAIGIATGPDQVFHTAGATLTVDSCADDGGASTLRSMIAGALPGDSLSLAMQGSIYLTQGELFITNNLTLLGPGPTNLVISGFGQSRVFEIATGAVVSVSGLTITDGLGAPSAGYAGPDGGGIYNAGTLTLSNCFILGNSAGSGQTGSTGTNGSYAYTASVVVGGPGGAGGAGGNGGGVCNVGTLAVVDCQITGNAAGLGGTGGGGGQGGQFWVLEWDGYWNEGATGGAGGTGGLGGDGGGLFNAGTLSLAGCSLAGNSAGQGGTGGTGGTGGVSGTENLPAGYGGHGGTGGLGGLGGGLWSSNRLTLTNCTLVYNLAGAGGQGGSGGTGGSMGDFCGNGGTGGTGGGGSVGGAIQNSGSLALTACTLVNNSTGSAGPAGAGGPPGSPFSQWEILGYPGGPGTAGTPGVGAALIGGGALLNSIVADNTSTNTTQELDLAGIFVSAGYNLIGATNGAVGFTNGVNQDRCGTVAAPLNPLLAAAANNGGNTLTCAPLPGSPALETGDDNLLNPPYNLVLDQIGQPRLSGAQVDIGAYEATFPILSLLVTNLTSTSAALVASVIPSGSDSMAWFSWGLGTNDLNLTAGTSLGTGSTAVMVSNVITGLQPGALYYYALNVTNTLVHAGSPWEQFVPTCLLPVAAVYNLPRTAGLALHISWASVATNWSDPEGVPVTLAGLNLATTNGVTLQTNSTQIFYPASAPNVNDQICYTVTFAQGGTNTGLINIIVNPFVCGQQPPSALSICNNAINTSFYGVPGLVYEVQRCTNLNAGTGWVSIATNTVSPNGLINVTDQCLDLGGQLPPAAYYRLVWNP